MTPVFQLAHHQFQIAGLSNDNIDQDKEGKTIVPEVKRFNKALSFAIW